MSVDYKRVVEAAVNAAFNENHADAEQSKKHGSGGVKAVAAGAALVAVARVAAKKVPGRMASMALPNIGDLTDRVRDRLTESGWLGDDEDEGYEDGDDYDVEGEADYADEPEEDDPEEDEPEDDEPEEDEPEAEEEPEVEDEAELDDEADYDDED